MTTAKELLKQRYYEPIKEQPELFVGIELEYPVVNLSGNATDVSLTKQLLVYLLDNFDFQADKYDSDTMYSAKLPAAVIFYSDCLKYSVHMRCHFY